MSYTDIMAVLTSLPTVMQRYLAEGHTVKLEGIGTFYISVQCSKTGVEKKELCSAEQITNVKVQFRPEMETPSTGRKGKRKNTLVADDLSWTYLPATEKKNYRGRRRHTDTNTRPDTRARRRLKDNNARKRLKAQSPQSIITLPQKTKASTFMRTPFI